MTSVFLVMIEDDRDGSSAAVQSVYLDKALAEKEASEIQSASNLIAYVDEKDVTDS